MLVKYFGCDFFHINFQSIQKSDSVLSTCASLYCSLQNILSKIREDFDELAQQAKVSLPNGNYKTLPQRDKEYGSSKKMTEARFGLT